MRKPDFGLYSWYEKLINLHIFEAQLIFLQLFFIYFYVD